MGRGGNWPPKSLAEWVVGQNFRGPLSTSALQRKSPVLHIELSEDEISGDETLSVTYPRGLGSSQKDGPTRKVRFDGDRKPLKSAMKKKKVSSSESSDTLVDSDDDDTSITDDESSVIEDSDTSEHEVPVRRRKSRSKKSKISLCKKEADSDSSAAKDALPHETCPCDECARGRKILKAVIKFEVKKKTGERDPKGKGKKGMKNDPEPSDTTEAETTEAETTEAEATDDHPTPSKKGKNKKQKQKQRHQNASSKETSPKESSTQAEEPKKLIKRDAFKMTTYPKQMQPNWIMPPHTKVVRIEHAVENENDPKPNAFFDSTKGIARVYHGPMFGNHLGELYGNYNADKLMPPNMPPFIPPGMPPGTGYPPGWGHHVQHDMYVPGPPNGPQGSHFSPNMPAMNAQMPPNETFLRDAASKGLGLSGMAAPSPGAQKATSKHAGSDKGSKTAGGGCWGATDFDTGGVGDWGKTNDNNNSWGGGGGWDNSGSKKDGVASPPNFNTWGQSGNNEEKFERRSNKSGSQNHESQKGGKGNGGGADATWGNGNGGGGDATWGASNDINNANDWNNSGGNGEIKPSPKASQRPFQSKTPSIANGMPGNGAWGGGGAWDQGGGGGNTWSNGNDANAWPNQTSLDGSKKNSPQQQQSGQNGWPPKSKSPSNNGSFNGNGDGSRRNSLQYQGAHAWPSGSKPPSNSGGGWDKTKPASNSGYENNNNNGGYGTPRGSRANSKTGQQAGPRTPYWQDASNQATGPSHAGSWKNADLAQHTGGKADQW